MREIKFRAFDKQYKKMCEVSMILFSTNEIDIKGLAGEPKSLEHFELMQYTGLLDKNGKEIYEGDIYHMGDKKITYTVVWHDSGLIGKQNGSSSYAGLEHWMYKIEVIGNIHETT